MKICSRAQKVKEHKYVKYTCSTVQQNGRFTLFSSKFHSMYNLFSLIESFVEGTNKLLGLYPQRMRLQRRLCGIYSDFFSTFKVPRIIILSYLFFKLFNYRSLEDVFKIKRPNLTFKTSFLRNFIS